MNYSIFSITSLNLKSSQINSICNLKDQEWKFGKISQNDWFRKNIKKNDIHNLLYINTKLIGYTSLRKKLCKIKNKKKKIQYLLFDTLIIDKKFKGKKLSNLLMTFNNEIIKQSCFFSFLICKNRHVNFYKKNKWIKINNKNINFLEHTVFKNGMIFNKTNANKHKYYFF